MNLVSVLSLRSKDSATTDCILQVPIAAIINAGGRCIHTRLISLLVEILW